MRVFVNDNIIRTCQIQDGGHFRIYAQIGFLPEICSQANPPKNINIYFSIPLGHLDHDDIR